MGSIFHYSLSYGIQSFHTDVRFTLYFIIWQD